MRQQASTKKIEPENHLDEIQAKWFAVYTKYKREKLIAKELERKGIECYLPIQKVLRQWGRKKKWVELPLLNCYVFVKITKPLYVKVREPEHVVQFVHFSRNIISIPDSEIDTLKKILQEDVSIERVEGAYSVGDEVEIIAGNLLGLKGKLIQKQGKHNFLIEFDTIGYAFQLVINPKLLRKR